MKTDLKVERVETDSKYYPMYHVITNDHRGKHVLKLDESTARLLVSELDVKINCTEKL